VDLLNDLRKQDCDGYSVLVLADVETFVSVHPDYVPFCEHGPVDILVIACDDLNGRGVNLVADAAVRYGTKILVLIERKVDCIDTVTQFPSNGFLIKDDVTEGALASALSQISSGEVPMPAMLANRLLERARGEVAPERPVVQKLTNKQIARRMLISQHGVKRLVANILSKLNCSNRTLAAAVAIKEGLLP
jgi:two-component system nitrate/nitrite response regulator NarL